MIVEVTEKFRQHIGFTLDAGTLLNVSQETGKRWITQGIANPAPAHAPEVKSPVASHPKRRKREKATRC